MNKPPKGSLSLLLLKLKNKTKSKLLKPSQKIYLCDVIFFCEKFCFLPKSMFNFNK